jgi:hypothetical protein
MKRSAFFCVGVPALMLWAAGAVAYAQGSFKIPFKFEAGGKKLPAGDYALAPKGEGQLALRQISGGTEVLIPFTKRLEQPKPPLEEPQLVFDIVGDFEPSYTEYVTEYVLSEYWLPGQEGYLVHSLKGSHQNKVIKAEVAKK